MKLYNVFLAGIVLGWSADVQSSELPTRAALVDGSAAAAWRHERPVIPTPSPAQGLAGAIEAGMADVSFEASAAMGAEAFLPPHEEEAPGISYRETAGTPSVSPVPEPSAITLMLAGVAALWVLLSRRRRGGS